MQLGSKIEYCKERRRKQGEKRSKIERMSAKNRKRISGEEAIQNILQFVEEESGDEESDLDELYGDENEINSDTNISCESSDSEKENDDPNANENANLIARRKHRRKQLTYTRLVNSIHSSL